MIDATNILIRFLEHTPLTMRGRTTAMYLTKDIARTVNTEVHTKQLKATIAKYIGGSLPILYKEPLHGGDIRF